MNFLQLVQRLKRECGVSGSLPSTLQGANEDVTRLANWINAAWVDIQELHEDWFFARKNFTFATVLQQNTYTPTQVGIPATPGLGSYRRQSLRIHTTDFGYGDEIELPYAEYNWLRSVFIIGNQRTNYARPIVFSVDPQRNIVVAPAPALNYTIEGEYYDAPWELAADTDTPTLPDRYHMLIVYRAMEHYGMYEAATEVVERSKREFDRMRVRLEMDQLPDILFGTPLA